MGVAFSFWGRRFENAQSPEATSQRKHKREKNTGREGAKDISEKRVTARTRKGKKRGSITKNGESSKAKKPQGEWKLSLEEEAKFEEAVEKVYKSTVQPALEKRENETNQPEN